MVAFAPTSTFQLEQIIRAPHVAPNIMTWLIIADGVEPTPMDMFQAVGTFIHFMGKNKKDIQMQDLVDPAVEVIDVFIMRLGILAEDVRLFSDDAMAFVAKLEGIKNSL